MTDQTVLTFQMPFGIPGAVNRIGGRGPDIEAQAMDPDNPLILYGTFGQIDAASGDFRIMAAADTTVYGALVRPYPRQATTANQFSGEIPLGTAVAPPTSGPVDVLKSGYMTVTLYGADAAAKNGTIYVIVDGEDATHPLGGVCAADDGANRIALPAGSYFMGPADANGNVEIAFNI